MKGRASNLLSGFLGGLVGVFAIGTLLALYAPQSAWTQASLLQGGGWTSGHLPVYGQSFAQPLLIDGGGAVGGGPGVGLAELLIVSQAQPGQGSGPFGTQHCEYDVPKTSAGGYHYLCFTSNDGAGYGRIVFGAGGLGTPLPLGFNINGTTVNPVACNGTPTASFAVVNGIVTHC